MERATTLGTSIAMKQWVQTATKRLATEQEKVATGVNFDRASEAPTASAILLRNQRSLDRLQQLDRNATNARLWLEKADATLNDGVASLTRARTLAIQGANEPSSPESRQAVANDLRTSATELLALANATVNGRAIFGGTVNSAIAYDATGTFVGNTGEVRRSVTPTTTFSVAASGPAVFGTPDGVEPLNGTVFEMINAIADAVEAGDIPRVRDGIEAIDTATSRMQTEIGRLGGLSNRLDEVQSRNEASQISAMAQISEVQDVDMTEGILRLRAAETSQQATLSAVARGLNQSLLDFIR